MTCVFSLPCVSGWPIFYFLAVVFSFTTFFAGIFTYFIAMLPDFAGQAAAAVAKVFGFSGNKEEVGVFAKQCLGGGTGNNSQVMSNCALHL